MRGSHLLGVAVAGWVAVLALVRPEHPGRIAPETSTPLLLAEGGALLSRIPSAFVPNLGQWEHPGRFVAKLGGGAVFLEDSAFLLSCGGAAVRLRFDGAHAAEIVGERRLAGEHAYFLGNDPSCWRTDVPLYGAVRYERPWRGVDVVCYEEDGHLEYDVALEPGADLAQVEFVVEGGSALRIDGEGSLLVETAAGPLRQARPATYEVDGAGARRELTARYQLRGEDRFGFVVTQWDGEEALVLDPGLLWSTFVGGSGDDGARALSVDASGVVTIAGATSSPSYPTTPGAWDTSYNGNQDCFVTCLDPSLPTAQQLLYSTFIGGSLAELGLALLVDAAGTVSMAGWTESLDFPTTAGAWDTSHNGGTSDAFVIRLDPSLPGAQQLLYSTFVGGSALDFAGSVSVDAAGIVTLAGTTYSSNYPTTPGAWDISLGCCPDVFVSRLDPLLATPQQLLYSTFVGGSNTDESPDLSVDAAGIVTIAGRTNSLDYPTTPGAWDTTHNGDFDVFVSRLDSSLPAAQQLLYSTFVGGVSYDSAQKLSVDGAGIVTFAGRTLSASYPTTAGAWDTTYNGDSDAFVSRLDPSLPAAQQLLDSTFVGGTDLDGALALSVDAAGIVTIAGTTKSPTYPTTPGAWDTSFNGPGDAFVSRLDMLPAGASPCGASTPGCGGPLSIGVTSWPQVGNATFALTCGNATASATGLLAFSAAGLATPISIFGANVWIDLASPAFFTAFVSSSAVGAALVPIPIPSVPALAGAQGYVQFFWAGPTSPTPCPPLGISASGALEITVQP